MKSLLGVFGAIILPFLLAMPPANATSINWTVTGQVGPLTTSGGGTDVEGLVDATITLSVFVDEGVYGDVFGLSFAPITSGEITIAGSTVAANNATFSFISPFGGTLPFGYLPFAPVIVDSSYYPLAFMLDSGNTLTLAHSFNAATPSGIAALFPGSPISIDDFPTGLGPLNFTVANHSVPPDFDVITQYQSTQAMFTATEISEQVPIPEPATMLLLGTGLVGVVGAARRRKKINS